MGDLQEDLNNIIRDVPDFPRPGILFKDITPMLGDPALFGRVTDWMSTDWEGVDKIVGVESRGFIFAGPMVDKMGVGMVLARKAGKLPHTTVSKTYDLEYGQATLQLHSDSISKGDRVLIVDDLLATGGTAAATIELVRELGGVVVGCVFVIELGFIPGRKHLESLDVPVRSLLTF